jgi:endonuclease YncB( thermonuclease family)
VSSSALEEPSNIPILPSPTPLPDGITLYSGNDCKDRNVGVTDGAPGQLIQFTTNDRFQDDEARSLLFRRLAPGTIIRLYADSAGNTSNDWVEILVKQKVEGYCVISFETSFEDVVISVNFSNVDGLDGKVSLMTVDRVMVEVQLAAENSTPTVEPTAAVTATLIPTVTPLPAIPPIPEAECIPTVTEREFATVSNVVNGDTMDVLIDGVSFRVRYIGVDAPEAGEPYSSQATSQNIELVQGKTVTLVKDASNTDEEGSLLRYVLFGNAFVNYSLVREGSAQASISQPDVACDMTFAEAQNQAVSEGAGQWALIPTPLSPTHTPASVPNIQITFILFDGAVPQVESDEFAQITNQGSLAVNLQGWRLNAGAPEQDFYFPNFQLDPGLSCRIYTNENHPEYCGFSFGRAEAIWRNTGDCGYLYDDEGAQVSKFCY